MVPVWRYQQRRQREIAWLQVHGWRVSVVVDRVTEQRGPAIGVAGAALATRHVLIANAWDDPQGGQRYTFSSDPLRGTVAEDLAGATVDVLIDPDNPNRYWMDVNTLR